MSELRGLAKDYTDLLMSSAQTKTASSFNLKLSLMPNT